MSVKSIEEVKKEKVAAGINTYFQVLIGADEGPSGGPFLTIVR